MLVLSVAGQATRDFECFGDNAHEEHRNVSLSHAREKFARVNACEVRCS